MFFNSKRFRALTLVAGLFALISAIGWQSARADDMFKDIKGVVKSIDKGTKTMVVKAADGTEHTIKWTGDTTVEATKDAGKGIAKGSMDTYDGLKAGTKVSVKYTEKAGEKTAVAVKDASKATAKAVTQ
jgi:hypothetical protein